MTRLYRILLRLYPAGFRREYGDEMAALFAARASAEGGAGRIRLLAGAAADTVANAVPLHVEMLGQDLRYTARTLRRAPGFALTAILVTAIAVGANTAAFSVADFVLLRPLPFPEPETLVRLCAGPRTGPVGWGCNNQLSPADYRDFRDQTSSFAALGAYMRDAVNLVDGGEPARVPTAFVTSEVLPLVGVRPLLGTWHEPDADATSMPTVVIGHGLWQSRFGGDRNVLGRIVGLDGAAHAVVGVMPPEFRFPGRDVQLWTPLRLVEADFEDRGNNYLEAVGRLADGVTFEQARADLDVIVERLARAYPETNEETGVSFFRMREEFSPRNRLMLQALCGAALCILLLACANLANLLLARASVRERELAVRAALGAGRERLARQMITESIALAAVGGAAGVLVAVLMFPLLSLLVPSSLPIGSVPGLNLRMLALAAVFTALTGIGFGVAPALRAGGRASLDALRGGRAGAHRQRYRAVLVAIEVGLCVVLLVSSGLLLRAVLRVQSVDAGFRADGVLTLRTVLPKPEYGSAEKRDRFYGDVLAQVRRLPGVRSAAYTSGLPMVMTGGIARVVLPGQEVRRDADYRVSRRYVTPGYFAALGVPLLAGRDLEDADATRSVAVVSESFAERYWPGEDALGRAFLFQGSTRVVVGVVGDIRVRGLERESEPQMYLPSSHIGDTPLSFHDPKELVVRTAGSELALVPAVRDIIRRVDPDQPVSDVRTLSDVLATQTAPRHAQVRVLAALAIIALLLAGLGIHGLLAYTVAQQRHDIAVRLALGAEPARIARNVVRNGMSIVLLGVVPGLLVAVAAAGSMRALLFGVPTLDPVTIVATVVVCIAMAATGAWLPARRALRVSPMSVMRAE
ncbi:MAG TPA: ABC transporter permease [Longimicrobiales bacterium]